MTSVITTEPRADPESIDSKEKADIVEKITMLLNEYYVFPESALKSTDFISEQFSSGAYKETNTLKQFVKRIKEDLQSVLNDKHVSVFVHIPKPRIPEQDVKNSEMAQIKQRLAEKNANYGFVKTEVLEGNVGYIKFDHFSGNENAKDTAKASLDFLSNVNALIIDMSNNRGGSSDMVNFMVKMYQSARFIDEATRQLKIIRQNIQP